MKVKFITSAGVTTASIQTELTKEQMEIVKAFNPNACKLFNEDKKMVFGLGMDVSQSVSKDGTIVNLEAKKGNLTYRRVLIDANDKEKTAEKVELITLAKKIEKVEKQILEAVKEYNKAAEEVEEVNADEEAVNVEEGEE